MLHQPLRSQCAWDSKSVVFDRLSLLVGGVVPLGSSGLVVLLPPLIRHGWIETRTRRC
jgi:hypothetical protein